MGDRAQLGVSLICHNSIVALTKSRTRPSLNIKKNSLFEWCMRGPRKDLNQKEKRAIAYFYGQQ